MRKVIILFLFFISFKINIFSEKYESFIWYDLYSLGYNIGSNSISKIDCALLRLGYINLGVFTTMGKKSTLLSNNWNFDGKNSINYFFPIGFYIPISVSDYSTIGWNTSFYIFPKKYNAIDNEEIHTPKVYETGLRLDRNFFSLMAGYRFQSHKWEIVNNVNYTKEELGRLDGFFFEISLGLMKPIITNGKNKGKLIYNGSNYNENNYSMKPKLTIDGSFIDNTYNIFSGEYKDFIITIENLGEAAAEDLNLNIKSNSKILLLNKKILKNFSKNLDDLQSYSREEITINIGAIENLVEDSVVELTISCVDANGFSAKKTILVHVNKINETKLEQNTQAIQNSKQNLNFNNEPSIIKSELKKENISLSKKNLNFVDSSICEIDTNFPEVKKEYKKGVALVIGNSDFIFYPQNKIKYALNDCRIVSKYAENVFNFRKVICCENVGFAQLRTYLGTEDKAEGELFSILREREPVLIYINSHGHSKIVQGQKAKSYIIPSDGNISDLEATSYSLATLYKNLAYLIENKKPQKFTLVLDTCFSGYLSTSVSSARWESDNPLQDLIEIGQKYGTEVTCIFATSETETAKWYNDKKHGLLTYFWLKALHNSENENFQKADINNDKKLTFKEMKDFILDKNFGVPYYANQSEIIQNADKGQNPILIGDDNNIIIEYK